MRIFIVLYRRKTPGDNNPDIRYIGVTLRMLHAVIKPQCEKHSVYTPVEDEIYTITRSPCVVFSLLHGEATVYRNIALIDGEKRDDVSKVRVEPLG